MIPKPEPRAKAKARADRKFAADRKRCRETVYERDGWQCQRCLRRVSIDVPTWAANFAHVNEIIPRSRGGSAVDPDNCELLCRECHLPNGQHASTAERMARLKGAA